ncbi:MAG: hypothetical protein ACJ786_00355 [Catenulispora sp.]
MTPRIAILVPVLAAAGIAVAGCGGGDPSASGPASSTPAGSQSASPRLGVSVAPSNLPPAAGSGSAGAPGGTGATGDDKRGANGGSANGGSANGGGVAPLPSPNGNSDPGSLPAGFPLPQGTLLGRIAVSKTDITAPMQVPDGERAVAFWKKELPAAGYKISLAGVVKEIGDITFTGNGCKRGSDLAISGEQVAFLCRR